MSTRERADAARNRAKVLSAAETLFADKGAENVTMDDIAKAAGVGRGTLYRRYPDRAAIAVALLDEHERKLQEQLIRGDPPLGPGAPPAERLAAFYAAMLDLLAGHGHLVLGSEIGHQRFGTGAYGFWRVHVHALLTEAGLPDPDGMVDAVLAPLAPELFRYQRERGVSLDRLKVNLGELALRLCGLPGDAADHA
ncbi:AcrR family transcriptional regulator [Amycolatopsis magusensis]|uniref:AcrR family transcriptional regulator n=1 Tax=Amycolatopsis magusensis TaxID=882444 RepID=A0ABS4Q323_9PSEU|nr:AcrR family transcriptional regulator [Amycolatopsis magusensis]